MADGAVNNTHTLGTPICGVAEQANMDTAAVFEAIEKRKREDYDRGFTDGFAAAVEQGTPPFRHTAAEEAKNKHRGTPSGKMRQIAVITPRSPDIDKSPPLPWNVQWVGGFAYVIDAEGKKIASLLGSQKRREHVAAILCDIKP